MLGRINIGGGGGGKGQGVFDDSKGCESLQEFQGISTLVSKKRMMKTRMTEKRMMSQMRMMS
jgi:hypothetical protein